MLLKKVFKPFIVLPILWLLVACSCSVFKPQHENLISGKENYYTIIDPVTIMTAIRQGDKTNLFVPHEQLDDQSDMWSLPFEKSVHWNQDDYFRVVQAFNQYIRNEPLENWKVKMIYLDYDCADAGAGFDRATLKFFKVGKSGEDDLRTILTIDIMPWRKIIRQYEAVYSPVVENWDALDLKNIKVSAGQAVEIAEKNGGSNVRANLADKCSANVSMIAPGSGYGGWTVRYFDTQSKDSNLKAIFEILIDPQDGNFRLVSP